MLGGGRNRPGYPAAGSVCGGPRAGFRQHRTVGTIRHLGGNHSWLVVASGVDRRFAGATRGSPPSPGAGRHRSRTRISARWASRGWKQAGFDLAHLPEISVNGVDSSACRKTEYACSTSAANRNGWQATLTEQPGGRSIASGFPLPRLISIIPLAVHCQSGYRSMIACSLLQRAGFKNVMNVSGGFAAWQQAQLPVATGAPVEASDSGESRVPHRVFAAAALRTAWSRSESRSLEELSLNLKS